MSYFPAFIKLDNKRILIIGGGKIAQDKLLHLLEFSRQITLISESFTKEIMSLIEKYSLSYLEKRYEEGDLSNFDLVVAAIDNLAVQKNIYHESRNYRCLYNCVDIQEYCDFIFPSYIKKGDLTIAISTSGSSPAMAKQLKIWLENIIPDSIVEFLIQMKEYRKTMPKGKDRMIFLDSKVKDYINSWKEKK